MKSIQAQKEYYNQRWADVGYCNRLELARCSAILGALYKTELREPQILDCGCGTGWMTAILGQFGPTTGWDLSTIAVETARTRYPQVRFEAVDVSAIDGQDHGEFDVIVSQEVIEHFEDQAAHIKILRNLLRKGGYLILTTPAAQTFYAMTKEQRESWTDQPIENWLTLNRLRDLLSDSFEVCHATTLIHGFGQAGLYRLMHSVKLVKLMHRLGLNEWYDQLRSSRGLGLHTLVLCRKA